MKYDCQVIKDLLPLVQDDTASPASKAAVAEHLEECASCRRCCEQMKRGTVQADAAFETKETANYKKLAQRLSFRKNLIRTGMAFIVAITALGSYAYVQGLRLDAQQAAGTNRYVDEQSILLGEVEIGSYKAFFYENDDKYRTVLTEKAFGMWKRGSGSSWANKTDDKVKMVGWISMSNVESGKGITGIPVQSFDRQVAYLEMGPEGRRITKDAPYGETVIFAWDRAIRWNDLNGIAYSGEGKPLYRLGYDMANTPIRTDELRWLPVSPEGGE